MVLVVTVAAPPPLLCRKERDSKNLFGFTCLLLFFSSVEALYALQVNSLGTLWLGDSPLHSWKLTLSFLATAPAAISTGLLSDAFHMFFHCLAMMASLAAMLLARKPATFEYSYGFDRIEVLAAFAACTSLIFVRSRTDAPSTVVLCLYAGLLACRLAGVQACWRAGFPPSLAAHDLCAHACVHCMCLQVCLFIGVQALHRMTDPTVLSGTLLLEFGVAGLAINILGLVLFGKRNMRLMRAPAQALAPSSHVHGHANPGHQTNLQVCALSWHPSVMHAAPACSCLTAMACSSFSLFATATLASNAAVVCAFVVVFVVCLFVCCCCLFVCCCCLLLLLLLLWWWWWLPLLLLLHIAALGVQDNRSC